MRAASFESYRAWKAFGFGVEPAAVEPAAVEERSPPPSTPPPSRSPPPSTPPPSRSPPPSSPPTKAVHARTVPQHAHPIRDAMGRTGPVTCPDHTTDVVVLLDLHQRG
jgi:hypothetical protein